MRKLLLLLFIPCLLLSQDYPFRGNIVPHFPNTNEIGLDTLRWEKLWVSQLEATVFAKQSISLVGGFLRLGKNTGVLESPCYALYGMNFMDFGQSMTVGDIVEFREAGQVEYVRVLSLKAANQYYVARNLDGTGVNYWKKGSPYSVIGQAGNGWVDLQSYGNTKISMYAVHDTTYNNWNEILRIGDLNGNWGYSGEQYGMVVGSYSNNSAYLTIDTVNGIRLRHRNSYGISSDMVRIEPDGDAYFTGNMTISNQGSITISGFNNDAGFNHTSYQTTAPTSPTTGDMWYDTDAYLMYRYNGASWDRVSIYMDANGLYARTISGDSITAGTITGSTLQTGTSGQRIIISSDGTMEFWNNLGHKVATLNDYPGSDMFYIEGLVGVQVNQLYSGGDCNITGTYKISGSALTYSDVGAAASSHSHAQSDLTSGWGSVETTVYVAATSGGSPTVPIVVLNLTSGSTIKKVLTY
jgi:hypothetical protein